MSSFLLFLLLFLVDPNNVHEEPVRVGNHHGSTGRFLLCLKFDTFREIRVKFGNDWKFFKPASLITHPQGRPLPTWNKSRFGIMMVYK